MTRLTCARDRAVRPFQSALSFRILPMQQEYHRKMSFPVAPQHAVESYEMVIDQRARTRKMLAEVSQKMSYGSSMLLIIF